MREVRERPPGRQMWWGVVLIAIGSIFLLERFGIVSIGEVWHYWPAFLILAGIGQLLWPDNCRRGTRGIGEIGIGLWFFACQYHWYGLTYTNGWPLILVIMGFALLVRSLIDRPRTGGEERHV